MHFFNRVFFRVVLCAIIRNERSMGSLQYLNVHFFEDVFYCNLRCVWAQNKVKKSVPAPKIHNDVKCQYLIDKLLDLTNWLRNSEVSLCNPTSALSQLYWYTNHWDTLWSKITVCDFQKIPLKKCTAKTSWEIIILTSSIRLNLSILFNNEAFWLYIMSHLWSIQKGKQTFFKYFMLPPLFLTSASWKQKLLAFLAFS